MPLPDEEVVVETPAAPLPALLTTQNAAAMLGITPAGVQAAILSGKLAAEKFGKAWMIRREDAEMYAASDRKPGRKTSKIGISRGEKDGTA